MTISCCTWALTGSESEILTAIASTDIRHIDYRPFDFHTEISRQLILDLGLIPTCMATGFGMPGQAALDSVDPELRSVAIKHTRRALEYADEMDIRRAYVLPGEKAEKESLKWYAESVFSLANIAAAYGVKLCIEHFPGKALESTQDTLEFINRLGHKDLYLLIDIGHTQISNEDPIEAITRAGDRLGYFHLDDNDGYSDLHWGLLDGVLTEDVLNNTLGALKQISYDGPVSLEINPSLPDPLAAIKAGFQLVDCLYQSTTDPSSAE